MPELVVPSAVVRGSTHATTRKGVGTMTTLRAAAAALGLVLVGSTAISCDNGAAQREADARASEQAAKEQALAAEKRALEAERQTLDAQKAAAGAAEEAAAAREAQTKVVDEATKARGGRVTIRVAVSFAATKLDGTAWDVGLGPQPDPLLVARIASSGKTMEFNAPDNNGVANATWDVDLAASDSVTISCYDEDLTNNDLGGNFLASFEGRAGSKSGRNGAVQFDVSFTEAR